MVPSAGRGKEGEAEGGEVTPIPPQIPAFPPSLGRSPGLPFFVNDPDIPPAPQHQGRLGEGGDPAQLFLGIAGRGEFSVGNLGICTRRKRPP